MNRTVQLPAPDTKGAMPVECAIQKRCSHRSFSGEALSLPELAQVLWCAQGLTGQRRRAAPSAGATYPIELLAAVGSGTVAGLEAGVYRYVPARHVLLNSAAGDIRSGVADAAWGQRFLASAPADLLIAAVFGRTTGRYGEGGIRYVHMEVGCVAQNVHLQCEALGLGTVMVGAFDEAGVAAIFGLPADVVPLCLMPVGRPGRDEQ